MGLTRAQKALVTEFKSISGCNSSLAERYLQDAGWNMDAAFNEFLDDGHECQCGNQNSVDQAKLSQWFEKYRDEDSKDVILAEGIEAFCQDLQVDPADIVMLVISCYLEAKNNGEFTRQEFVSGMTNLGCDNMSKLKTLLPGFRQQLKQEPRFKLDMAIGMWRLIFAERPWPLLDHWCNFLTTHHKHAISRDTWLQLLDFTETVKPDMSNFDDNAGTSAWPYLIDDFVASIRSERAERSKDVITLE